MATFKLKDKNGVETTYTKSGIKIPNSDGTGYVTFGGGIPGTYTVSLSVDGTITSSIAVPQGKQIETTYVPTKSGHAFIGWSTTSGGPVNITLPYTPVADITLYAVFVEGGYCTVRGLGSESTSSVTFTKNNFPMNFETVTKDGNTFIKIPTMYRKIEATSSGQITAFTIANSKIDNTYKPYPCFVKEDGVTVMDYVLIGKYYSNSTSVMNSVNTSTATQTISNGRNNARSLGNGYQLYDVMLQKLWQDLIICKMETVNINSGSGLSTDSFGIYWGSSSNWIDGISYQGSSKKWAICYQPSKYVDEATGSTDGYQEVSYTLSGTSGAEITTLGYDSNHEFFNYPKATTSNSSYNTYYCDAVWFGTSTTHPVYSYVGIADALSGAFRCNAGYSWSGSSGVRLCYRPL